MAADGIESQKSNRGRTHRSALTLSSSNFLQKEFILAVSWESSSRGIKPMKVKRNPSGINCSQAKSARWQRAYPGWLCYTPARIPLNPKRAMAFTSAQEITQLLRAWNDGDAAALERLTPLVYQELHRLAHRHLARERHDHSLQTSALVNEAYLRLVDAQQVNWQNRAHFFGVSARLMRQILVDFARQRDSQKRGGEVSVVGLEDTPNQGLDIAQTRSADLVTLDDALNLLATLHQRQSQIVELRFFGGLSEAEIAEVLHVSERTVRSDWRVARAWLQRELSRA